MRINEIKIDFITHYSHLLLSTIFDFRFSISNPIFIHFFTVFRSPVTQYTEIEMGDSANTFSTLFPFSTPTTTIISSSTTGSLFQADMFNHNVIPNNMNNNNYYPIKQESFSKFYYLNRFISFFHTFLYDDESIEKVGNNNNDNANNGKKVSSSYQNGNYNYANKVRDSVCRNKPEKPYHPSENHSLLSYQNGGDEEEEEEEEEK